MIITSPLKNQFGLKTKYFMKNLHQNAFLFSLISQNKPHTALLFFLSTIIDGKLSITQRQQKR